MNAEPTEQDKQRKERKDRVDWTDEEIKQIATQVAKQRIKKLDPSLFTLVRGAIAQLPKDRQRTFSTVPTYLKEEIQHCIIQEIKTLVPPPPPIKLEELNEHQLQTQLELIINKLTPDTALRSVHDCFSAEELLAGCDTPTLLQHLLNKAIEFGNKFDKLTRLAVPTTPTNDKPKPTTVSVSGNVPEQPKDATSRKPKVAIDGFKNDQIQQIQSAVHDKFTVFSLRKSGGESAKALDIRDAEVYIVNIKWTHHPHYHQIKDHANKTGKLFIEHRGGTSPLIQRLRELKLQNERSNT